MEADDLPVIYQITGHDEGTLGSEFQSAVEKANMSLSSIELLNEESVPEDASAIIINAPQKDFNEADAKKVIDYLKAGGKAIIIGSYTDTDMPNFDSILETYNVEFTKGVISENDAQHYYKMGGPFFRKSTVEIIQRILAEIMFMFRQRSVSLTRIRIVTAIQNRTVKTAIRSHILR